MGYLGFWEHVLCYEEERELAHDDDGVVACWRQEASRAFCSWVCLILSTYMQSAHPGVPVNY